MSRASIGLNAELADYVVEHGSPPDELQRGLIAETDELGGAADMQIAPEQGAFLTFITRVLGATRAIEIGTFTGYSALCIARGLPADGQLVCCDVSDEWTSIARRYWADAGVADRIRLHLGPALDTLSRLGREPPFDLAFIDADKENYARYFEELVSMVRPGGVILVDNVLWSGRVVAPDDATTRAIDQFNNLVRDDHRVETVMIPVGDGLTLLRVR